MKSSSDYQLTAIEVYPRQQVRGFQLSTDGRWLSFLSQRDLRTKQSESNGRKIVKSTSVADLFSIPSSGGYPQQLTNTGDVTQPGVWSPCGRRILLGRKLQLQILELGEQPADSLTIRSTRVLYEGKLCAPKLAVGDVYLLYPQWQPPNGNYILFATQEGTKTILRTSSTDGRHQRHLFSKDGTIIGWNWSADGRKVLFVTRDENGTEGNINILDFESAELESQWPKEKDYQYERPVAAWTPRGNQIVFRSNRSGWSKLWIAYSDGSDTRPLTSGDWDDYAFRFSLDGDHVVYASTQEQAGSGEDIWIIPISGGTPRRLTEHPGTNVPMACLEDRIFYWHSSATESGDVWTISLTEVASEPTRLTVTTPAEFKRKLRAPVEVTIYNEDGTKIPTLIYLPADYQDNQQYPVIVWVRGGPAARCKQEFKPLYNWLANLGYIVITPNYRGSIGYGVQHMSAVLGDGVGKNDLSDILATAKYVKDGLRELVPNINLERGIGIGGQSWGGYMTLMAITQSPNTFSCAVAGAAISDWRIQQAETEVRNYDHWLIGGWVYEQEERSRTRSPINFVDQIRVPLLIYHGKRDRDVPFSQIEAFVQKARDAGVSIEKIFYAAEEHDIKELENQEHNLRLMGDFFRKHLQPWNFTDNPCADQLS